MSLSTSIEESEGESRIGMKRRKMGDSSSEIVVPRANEYNFGFAFNDIAFSDRILRLVIIPDNENIDSDKKLGGQKYHEWFSSIEGDCSKDFESCDGAKVVTLHIISAILAEKSQFFYKLFKNGMRESQKRNDVSLRISKCEEATLMDLLSFIYGNKLSTTSVIDLVDLLMAADKFEVTSCMRYAIQMLLNIPMSSENAFLYLELPPSVSMSEIVQPLIDEAKKYVAAQYTDFTKFKEEAMELPLSAVEVVLETEGLRVRSEDDVFDFIVKWARARYPELKERREILTQRLVKLVCFPNMSSSKLKGALVCPDFDHKQVSKLVVEALFSKVELPCKRHIHLSEDLADTCCRFSRRAYSPCCVVYFDLKKDELKSLTKSKMIHSRVFCLGGNSLYLSAKRERGDCLGLYLFKEKGTNTCTLNFKFAVMNKSCMEFQTRAKSKNRTYDKKDGWGSGDLLGIPWTEIMSHDSDYFIDGILRIRAEITLVGDSQLGCICTNC